MEKENKSKLTRRSFIGRAASGTALIALGPVTNLIAKDYQQLKLWPANSSDFKFHMIGHAHIDPVWLWSWSEGVGICHKIS
jgi:alpha-mannosidase